MRHRCRQIALRLWFVAVLALALTFGAAPARAGEPQGQLTWGVHVTLAPTWFDPAETPGLITPYMVLYALHDAMAKPMPGQPLAPSLAESWSASEDALSYEFVLRQGVKFHNGDPVTAEDVKFSFERYRGASAKMLHDRVAAVETPDARHIRFKLKQPWPDFLTFYVTSTGAGWIVPKKYVEQVGEDSFKRAPVGAGPYKFVSFTPGQELVLEAFGQYWRKTPNVRRLVLRSIPDESTRLAALKRGEVDIVYSIRAELAEELQRTKGLTLKPAVNIGMYWLYFPDQWDAKSPWHDPRVRRAATLAIDYPAINQAITLGHSRVTGSIIPDTFEFYWKPPTPAYDPAKARALLAQAGFPNGIDVTIYFGNGTMVNDKALMEAIGDMWSKVGIRAKLEMMEMGARQRMNNERAVPPSGLFLGNPQSTLLDADGSLWRIFHPTGFNGKYWVGSQPGHRFYELMEQARYTLDPKKRKAFYAEATAIFHEEKPSVELFQEVVVYGTSRRVSFKPRADFRLIVSEMTLAR